MSDNISAREIKAAQWRRVLAEQAASGKSICMFCRERQISRYTFQYWREKFSSARRTVGGKRSPDRFIAVSHSHSKLDSPRIMLPNGVTIDLGVGLDSTFANQFLLSLCGVSSSGGSHAKP